MRHFAPTFPGLFTPVAAYDEVYFVIETEYST